VGNIPSAAPPLPCNIFHRGPTIAESLLYAVTKNITLLLKATIQRGTSSRGIAVSVSNFQATHCEHQARHEELQNKSGETRPL
jgi:hypothetical protein